MGKYQNTKAIVLKRFNYKEADKMITLFTLELGKLTAIAKGIRKVKSAKRGHLELFNIAEIQTTEHRNWHILIQAESIKSRSNIKKDYQLTSAAYYITEVFEKLTPELEPNRTLFIFLDKTLDLLDQSTEEKALTIVNAFNLKILRILGYYSRSETKSLHPSLKSYLNFIELSKYEEISQQSFDKAIESQAYNFLRNLTEEILERSLKTKLFI